MKGFFQPEHGFWNDHGQLKMTEIRGDMCSIELFF